MTLIRMYRILIWIALKYVSSISHTSTCLGGKQDIYIYIYIYPKILRNSWWQNYALSDTLMKIRITLLFKALRLPGLATQSLYAELQIYHPSGPCLSLWLNIGEDKEQNRQGTHSHKAKIRQRQRSTLRMITRRSNGIALNFTHRHKYHHQSKFGSTHIRSPL